MRLHVALLATLLSVAGTGAVDPARASSVGLCGNGRLDPGEECDDGNLEGDDCCAGCHAVRADHGAGGCSACAPDGTRMALAPEESLCPETRRGRCWQGRCMLSEHDKLAICRDTWPDAPACVRVTGVNWPDRECYWRLDVFLPPPSLDGCEPSTVRSAWRLREAAQDALMGVGLDRLGKNCAESLQDARRVVRGVRRRLRRARALLAGRADRCGSALAAGLDHDLARTRCLLGRIREELDDGPC